MPVYRGNCKGEAGCCPGVLHYQSRRVFYNLLQRGQLTPAQQSWSQPTRITDLLVADADGGDQAQAVVALHSVACIRELTPGGPPGIQPGVELANPSQQPPISQTFLAAPTPDLGVTPLTVGRGAGVPQYRVRFRDVTRDDIIVFVDGSSVLSHPASQVDVAIMTPANAFVLEPNEDTPAAESVGLYVDAEASASVSWGSRVGSSGALGGLATFTQTQLVQDDNDPIAPTPGTMLFERPPFAHEVCVIPDPSLIELAGGFLYSAEFVSGATRSMGAVALGLRIGTEYGVSARACVPAPATHIRIVPDAAAPVGAPIHCVWQIGVR